MLNTLKKKVKGFYHRYELLFHIVMFYLVIDFMQTHVPYGTLIVDVFMVSIGVMAVFSVVYVLWHRKLKHFIR